MFRRPAPCALALAALICAPGPAGARRKVVSQSHEFRLDIDVAVSSQANAAFVDAQYTFIPNTPIQSRDVVAALLRRFVHAPSALWARVRYDGVSQFSGMQRIEVAGGGTFQLVGGRGYASAELGLERDEALNDLTEGEHYLVPFRLAIGGRPLPLFAVGAYWRGRPIIDAGDSDAPVTAKRAGSEHEAGLELAVASSRDRVYATLSAGWRRARWHFTGYHEGDFSVDGLRAAALVSIQESPRFSWQLRGTLGREAWDNDRLGVDETQDLIPIDAPFDATVQSFTADVGVLYWHEGLYGFRFAAGGGYQGARPETRGDARGSIRFSLGVTSRW